MITIYEERRGKINKDELIMHDNGEVKPISPDQNELINDTADIYKNEINFYKEE